MDSRLLKRLTETKILIANSLQSPWCHRDNLLTLVSRGLIPNLCTPRINSKLLTLIGSLTVPSQLQPLSWGCKATALPVASWIPRTECPLSLEPVVSRLAAPTLTSTDQQIKWISNIKTKLNSKPHHSCFIHRDSSSSKFPIGLLLHLFSNKWPRSHNSSLWTTISSICREACPTKAQSVHLRGTQSRFKITSRATNPSNKPNNLPHLLTSHPWQLLWHLGLQHRQGNRPTGAVQSTMMYLQELNWRNFLVRLILY